MRAMVMTKQGLPLQLKDIPVPEVQAGELLIRVSSCGICRTDLHVLDGDLTEPVLPLVPGHQIVGSIEAIGAGVENFAIGQRVGVPWLGGSCGKCDYCRNGQENLCDAAVYTGYQKNGGFAEFTTANAGYCFPIPETYSDMQAAPLLCAGLIGFRSYRQAMHAKTIALYG
ncbi:MAG: alcohol dehydrogenase catalytic domain-containing protein, partial [Proteobacteria bacterium]|nr:alcohol dehydrogenase catalytic domain-containing protein [Pseudomonadota bacterium]